MPEQPSTTRWVFKEILRTEHFKNTITLILVLTYCWMMLQGIEPDSQFALLVGMVLGFYFKQGGTSDER